MIRIAWPCVFLTVLSLLAADVASAQPAYCRGDPVLPRRGYFASSLPDELRDLRGSGVVVGIVYTAVDWEHDAFEMAGSDSTRIERIYDWHTMDPAGGREWTRAQIDSLRRTDRADAGAPPPDRTSHGTAVALLAAGDARDCQGVAPSADLVIFLPGDGLPSDIWHAVQYIFAHAGDRPAVACVPRGTIDDPTAARDLLPLPAFGSSPNRIIVAAAGNLGDRDVHASAQLSNVTGRIEFPIRIPATDAWSGGVLVNAYYERACPVTVSLVDPNGDVLATVEPGGFEARPGLFRLQNGAVTSSSKGKVILTLTNRHRLERAEEWRLVLEPSGACASGRIDAWVVVPRNPLPVGAGEWEGVRFTAHTSDSLLVEWPASLPGVLAVGGFDSRTGRIASFSSPGWTSAAGAKPDFAAPATCLQLLRSSRHEGAAAGAYPVFDGTSEATAIVAGLVALVLERSDVPLGLPEVRERLRVLFEIDGAPPDHRFGYGKLLD